MKLNTFSIIARCAKTGHLGAASASTLPGIGAFSPYVLTGTGILVIHGWLDPVLGKEGLKLLQTGLTANETLNRLMVSDPGREQRQISVLDRYGNCAAYTGVENDEYKAHLIGSQYSIQGTFLPGPEVLEAMQLAYENTEGELAHRLLSAIEAGDLRIRGASETRSTYIKVEAVEGFPYVDYRVDDHFDPVLQLRKIYDTNKKAVQSSYFEWIESVRRGIEI
jgi:uncharacterized Ntn-hydrolase superfamily protein